MDMVHRNGGTDDRSSGVDALPGMETPGKEIASTSRDQTSFHNTFTYSEYRNAVILPCDAGGEKSKMSWLRSWQNIYSLETLDTRFVVPANTPPRISASDFELNAVQGAQPSQLDAVRERSASSGARTGVPSDIKPPLWGTLEFYFYYFIFVTIVPLMFYIPYTVSKRTELVFLHEVFDLSTNPRPASHPNYLKYVNLLSNGWIPGRKVVSQVLQNYHMNWATWLTNFSRITRTINMRLSGTTFRIWLQ